MTKKLIAVNYEIPGHSEDCHDYGSDQSLLDADTILFTPQSFGSGYGRSAISEEYSYRIQQQSKHWRSELLTALKAGKTVFFILAKQEEVEAYTGRSEVKGRTKVNYTANYSNYECLPVTLPPVISKGGSEIVFKGHPVFAAFWKEFGDSLSFEAYLDGTIDTPVFVTRTGERPVGGVLKVGAGHLVLMPTIEYDQELFVETNAEGESEWSQVGMEFGRRLVGSLLNIDVALSSSSMRTPAPSWVTEESFRSARESELVRQRDTTTQSIERLVEERHEIEEAIASEKRLKDLLFETGKALEDAVTYSLRALGYRAENYADGTLELDQVINSPEGARFIGECEGKDNAAVNIDKFRQLEENIQADLQRDEVTDPAIGILFGNGFRLTPPAERAEQFTQKCLASAKRGTTLVRTADLYPVVRYVESSGDEEFKRRCRDAIKDAIGGIVRFPATPR